MQMGAGTSHPATTLRALGPKPWNAAYVQPSRRPKDGRYGENPNRFQHYYQFQVILKPSPPDLQQLYLDSLYAIGIDLELHDLRFVEDDWENPTLGAWGLGWECWCDGMEVSQFTYFQQVAGIECAPVSGELTYGLERLAMYLQGVDNVFDLNFNGRDNNKVTYGDVFLQDEQEFSRYNFEYADTEILFRHFADAEKECRSLLEKGQRRRQTSAWRSPPTNKSSRPATPSTCSMRAASSRSPSARATSCASAISPRPAAKPGFTRPAEAPEAWPSRRRENLRQSKPAKPPRRNGPAEPVSTEHRIAISGVALSVSYGRDRSERMELRGTATLNANATAEARAPPASSPSL